MSAGKVVQPEKGGESAAEGDGSGPVASPRGPSAQSLDSLGVTRTVIGLDAVGYGFAAWLSIGPGAPNLGICARGKALRIGETGQVPEIEVENLGDAAMLVPAHLVVSGGWQTRAVERSAVIPARATARVPVKCVEAGRWAPRDDKTGKVFEVADRTSVRTRWSTSLNMSEQLSRHGRYAAEQSSVWQHVEEELSRSPEASHTRSYEAYLRGVKRTHMEAVRAAGARPPSGANAVMIFLRGGGFWLEAYPSAEALAEQSDDLLADLFDASVKQETEVLDDPPVEALLAALWRLPAREVERIAGTLGVSRALDGPIELADPVAEGAAPISSVPYAVTSATGAMLTIDGALAHLAVGGPPTRTPVRVYGSSSPASQQPASVRPASQRAIAAAVEARATLLEGSSPSRPAVAAADEGRAPAQVVPLSSRAPSSPASSSAPRDSSRGARVIPLISRNQPPPPPAEGPRVDRETMRAVFERARALVPDEPVPVTAARGYRLLRALDGNVSWVDIRVGGDGYAVLGSHDRCDLVLGNDAGIWLRHLLATCVRLEGGGVGVRLIDLKTDVPFYLEDDTPQWSATASGAFAVRLGRHVVCGFPLGAPPGEASADTALPGGLQSLDLGRGLRSVASPTITRGTRADEPFTIIPSAPISQIQELIGLAASPDHVRVTLERGGMGASVEIPVAALDGGVLLGRALNCFDGGLRRIFCDAVSRAHVLLLRDKDEVFALDLCTTNGTRVAGRRIRRYPLSDEGATLELGKKVLFRWHRRPLTPPQ